jgi:hypothetical protein
METCFLYVEIEVGVEVEVVPNLIHSLSIVEDPHDILHLSLLVRDHHDLHHLLLHLMLNTTFHKL